MLTRWHIRVSHEKGSQNKNPQPPYLRAVAGFIYPCQSLSLQESKIFLVLMHTASRMLAELSTGPGTTLSAIVIPPVSKLKQSLIVCLLQYSLCALRVIVLIFDLKKRRIEV